MQAQPTLPVHQPLSRQIVSIDGLRLMAAALVLGEHLFISAWLPSEHSGVTLTHAFDGLKPYFCYGWVGVPIFFVISGFVIAYSSQNVTAGTFARHRFFRLYPLAFLSATLILLWMEVGFRGQWPQSKLLAAYLRTLVFSPWGEEIDSPFWTLSVEAVFYLLVWLLIVTRRLRLLPGVMAVIGCFSSLVWLAATMEPYWSGRLHDFVRRVPNFFGLRFYTLVPHGCYFALGVLLWDSLLRRANAWKVAAMAVCVAGGLLSIRICNATTAAHFSMTAPWWPAAVLWLGSVAAIVFGTLYNPRIQQALGRHGVAVFRTMGLVTYPLYLLHHRIGSFVTLWLAERIGYRPAIGLAIVVVVSLAYVMATRVDPPIQRALKRRFSPAKPAVLAAA